MSSKNAKVCVDVDVKDIIQKRIQAEIVTALSDNPKEFVEACVAVALEGKKNSWSKETVFERAVYRMIQDAAKESFKEWIEEHKELLKNAIRKRLMDEPKIFVDNVANQVIAGLADSFYVSARLKVEDND